MKLLTLSLGRSRRLICILTNAENVREREDQDYKYRPVEEKEKERSCIIIKPRNSHGLQAQVLECPQ